MAQVNVKMPAEDEEFDTKVQTGGSPPENTDIISDVIKSTESIQENQSSIVSPSTDEVAAPDLTEEPVTEGDSAPVSEAEATPETEAPIEPQPTETAPEPLAVPRSTPEPEVIKEATQEDVKAEQPHAVSSKTKHLKRNILFAVLFLALAGLGSYAWTLYSDNQNLQKQVNQLKANPQDEVQKQTDQILESVSALTTLPIGETPTIKNVTDAAAANKESTFFANARNGDRVLLYVNAGKAILYRPSTNKIILVTPLVLDNNQTPGTSSTATPQRPAN